MENDKQLTITDVWPWFKDGELAMVGDEVTAPDGSFSGKVTDILVLPDRINLIVDVFNVITVQLGGKREKYGDVLTTTYAPIMED